MRAQKGQVLLLVVLTMVVALTVGLSIASRIVTELKISKQNEESQRAFQAAEAGIQETLKSGEVTTPVGLGNNAKFSTTIDSSSTEGTEININTGIEVDQDGGADVWLSDYDSSNPANTFNDPRSSTVTIQWGDSATQTQCSGTGINIKPALEIVILKGPDKNDPSIEKYVYEANGCNPASRLTGASPSSPGSAGFVSSVSISYADAFVMKAIPIYNSAKIRLTSTAGDDFPPQGKVVISKGTSGETARQIRYYTSLPQLPIEVFPYSIISQ